MPMSWPWQYRQTGCGGWMRAAQDPHSATRSRPSAPEVQKNAFSSVITGPGR